MVTAGVDIEVAMMGNKLNGILNTQGPVPPAGMPILHHARDVTEYWIRKLNNDAIGAMKISEKLGIQRKEGENSLSEEDGNALARWIVINVVNRQKLVGLEKFYEKISAKIAEK